MSNFDPRQLGLGGGNSAGPKGDVLKRAEFHLKRGAVGSSGGAKTGVEKAVSGLVSLLRLKFPGK
jgi:hypothetical protein